MVRGTTEANVIGKLTPQNLKLLPATHSSDEASTPASQSNLIRSGRKGLPSEEEHKHDDLNYYQLAGLDDVCTSMIKHVAKDLDINLNRKRKIMSPKTLPK